MMHDTLLNILNTRGGGVLKINYKDLAPLLIDYKHLILTFSFLITFHYKTSETSLAAMIGKKILMSICINNFHKSKEGVRPLLGKIDITFDSFTDFCA